MKYSNEANTSLRVNVPKNDYIICIPRVLISVQECGDKEKVEILSETPNFGLELSFVPNCRSSLISFFPRPQNLVSIFTNERVRFHSQSGLPVTIYVCRHNLITLIMQLEIDIMRNCMLRGKCLTTRN